MEKKIGQQLILLGSEFFVQKGPCDDSSRSRGVSGVFFAQRLPRAPKARAWVNHGLEYLNHGLEHGKMEKKNQVKKNLGPISVV